MHESGRYGGCRMCVYKIERSGRRARATRMFYSESLHGSDDEGHFKYVNSEVNRIESANSVKRIYAGITRRILCSYIFHTLHGEAALSVFFSQCVDSGKSTRTLDSRTAAFIPHKHPHFTFKFIHMWMRESEKKRKKKRKTLSWNKIYCA